MNILLVGFPDTAGLSDLTLMTALQWVAYWCLFWTIINAIMPPREIFNDYPAFQKPYNVLLMLIAYWGALNWRSLSVKIYGQLGVPVEPKPPTGV